MRDICWVRGTAGHLMKMRDCPSGCGTVDTYADSHVKKLEVTGMKRRVYYSGCRNLNWISDSSGTSARKHNTRKNRIAGSSSGSRKSNFVFDSSVSLHVLWKIDTEDGPAAVIWTSFCHSSVSLHARATDQLSSDSRKLNRVCHSSVSFNA